MAEAGPMLPPELAVVFVTSMLTDLQRFRGKSQLG
jgi:hypothetical protein